ncbi:MAG: hypothetical protein CML77_09160 [Rhodobiaceae bacterium]|nr:hypothetical protein [Rhodobiaceae bacterium]HCD16902.1 hypothetical protein [Rhodobiaceae bacterium]
MSQPTFNFREDFAPGFSVISRSIIEFILCFDTQKLLQRLDQEGNDANIAFIGLRYLVDIFGQFATKIFEVRQ